MRRRKACTKHMRMEAPPYLDTTLNGCDEGFYSLVRRVDDRLNRQLRVTKQLAPWEGPDSGQKARSITHVRTKLLPHKSRKSGLKALLCERSQTGEQERGTNEKITFSKVVKTATKTTRYKS